MANANPLREQLSTVKQAADAATSHVLMPPAGRAAIAELVKLAELLVEGQEAAASAAKLQATKPRR